MTHETTTNQETTMSEEAGTQEASGEATSTDRVVERTVEFAASVDRVWRAITDADELSKWFGDQTEIELVPGSEGAMTWENHGRYAFKVEVVEPPRRLVWSWVHEPGVAFRDAPSTRVEWELSPRPEGGTALFLRESGFLTDLHHEQNTGGWTEELAELVELLAT